MRALSVLVAVAMLSTLLPASAQANEPPRVHEIASVLEPPFNYYSVEAIDPELAELTYTWTISGNGRCADFTSSGATATWRHDDEERCPHDAAAHPGTITVVVSDDTESVTRTYAGGSAPHDPGEPEWRVAGTSFFGGNEEGDDPRDFPPPTIYGEELDCPATGVTGVFEPVQAVWQDENTDIFPEEPGRRLVITPPASATAELPLVVNKLTQLFGVRADRTHIYYNGSVTGTDRAPAVVRWTMKDASGERVLGEIDVGDMPLAGSQCGAPTAFHFAFDTSRGLEIRHFLPKGAGAYTITMELAERGGAAVPGSEVVVSGSALAVKQPRTYFVGTIVRNASAPGTLAAAARSIANDAAANIPDYFPLASGGFHTYYRPTDRDARPTVERAMARCSGNLSAFDWCRVEAARSAVESLFGGSSWMLRSGGGSVSVDRVAIIVSLDDMDNFLYPPAGSAGGFAAATKTFFLLSRASHYTTAHEFAHTTPSYAWLHPGADDCTVAYHNLGTGKGHGFQVSVGGAPARTPIPPKHGVMQGEAPDAWIEQCTYEHLLTTMNSLADPTLVGVRGWIAKEGEFEEGAFEAGMTFEGEPDRTPGGEGRFAIVLSDASGATLAEHRFDHPLTDDWGRERPMVSFSMAIERPEGLARIELVGESGVLATRIVTPNGPTLAITSPPEDVTPGQGSALLLEWSASDADGDALTYGVAYSADDGETWMDVDFDIADATIEIPAEYLALGTEHRVRVMATDGVNSVEVERAFGPRAPPATSTPAGGTPGNTDATAPAPAPGALLVALAIVGAALVLRRRVS